MAKTKQHENETPETHETAPSMDIEAIKAWVRREIMMNAHGADEEERKALNP